MVDELAGEFVYDSSRIHSELLHKLYLSHLHQNIKENNEVEEAHLATNRTVRSQYFSMVSNSQSATPWRDPSRSSSPRLLNSVLTDAVDTHSLYAHLHQDGRVPWSPKQLQVLFSENRCFKCSQTGHSAKDCTNAAADPKTVRFHHLTIDDTQDTCDQVILDDDAQMSALLLELTDSLN